MSEERRKISTEELVKRLEEMKASLERSRLRLGAGVRRRVQFDTQTNPKAWEELKKVLNYEEPMDD